MPTTRSSGGHALACVLTSAALLAQAPRQLRPLSRLASSTYAESAF